MLDTLTGPVEERALVWLAGKMPARVTPDTLTALGVVGAAVVFAGYCLAGLGGGWLWLVNLGLAVNWLGDSVDGTLARVRGIERPRYGFFIDHTVDVVSEGFVFLGLGLSPYVRFDLAALAFCGYLALSVHTYVRAFVDGTFKVSYSRIGPTELRIVLFVANAVVSVTGAPAVIGLFGGLTVFDLVVAAVALGLAVTFVASVFVGRRQLADVDSTPSFPSSSA